MAKPERHLDEFDLEAEREGRSIAKGNARRVRVTTKKSKVRNVDTKALDDAFDEHYGVVGYEAKKEEENET